jgi:hypothetical protein
MIGVIVACFAEVASRFQAGGLYARQRALCRAADRWMPYLTRLTTGHRP